LLLQGKQAIAEYYNDVCGRALTHKVEKELVNESQITFTEACQYLDGTRVLCTAFIDVQDGAIVRQLNLQAWDE
jgi:hypothetical protein